MAGRALRSAGSMAAAGPVKLAEALSVLRDAATALAELHAAGRVHGAVCAENIVLDEAGAARLCKDRPDPPVVSPEQQAGGVADARSDVYGLGATVADLLGGAGGLPEPFERLLARMTAAEPGERYQTMAEVLMALEACELMTGRRACRPGHEGDAARRRRRLLGAVVVGLSVVMLILALIVLLSPTPERQGEPPPSYKHLVDKMVPLPEKPATAARP